ncbi:MAG TPA: FkbM family methyltransferase [Polyangiales bacterium]|nr:FkbM family methyltransferase [Polyangiales bacterium]
MDMLAPSLEGLRRRLRGEALFEQQIALPKLQLGNDQRQFAIVPDLLLRSSIVYSFGCEDDAGFDLELIGRFGCSVHVFEPRPKTLARLREQTTPPQLNLHPFGLSDRDGVMNFAPLESSGSNHGRRGNGHLSSEYQVRRLSTLMRQLGHMHIDVLKLDSAGAEYVAVHALVTSSVRPTQLILQFQHESREFSAQRCTRALSQLNEIGYRIFDCPQGTRQFSLALV